MSSCGGNGAGPGPGGRSGAMAAGRALKHNVKERRARRSAGRGRVTPDKTLPSFPWDIIFILSLGRNLRPIPPHPIPVPEVSKGRCPGRTCSTHVPQGTVTSTQPPLSVTKVSPPLSPDRGLWSCPALGDSSLMPQPREGQRGLLANTDDDDGGVRAHHTQLHTVRLYHIGSGAEGSLPGEHLSPSPSCQDKSRGACGHQCPPEGCASTFVPTGAVPTLPQSPVPQCLVPGAACTWCQPLLLQGSWAQPHRRASGHSPPSQCPRAPWTPRWAELDTLTGNRQTPQRYIRCHPGAMHSMQPHGDLDGDSGWGQWPCSRGVAVHWPQTDLLRFSVPPGPICCPISPQPPRAPLPCEQELPKGCPTCHGLESLSPPVLTRTWASLFLRHDPHAVLKA